ncbi:phage minor tail protein L [Vibrio porteresiae]|uniref:Phage minor tail protein L n=1 Tax=Vibrio porteresiae DSM 19223 TaxID=1123496 RepID=A0ABZ0QBJ7_9VIBR|nr:phage minor tail protein L [Vibrio porteresiae]WPC72916.1 phage minor tail protein L [Vibrio porteresiae DSM 19223]
MSLTADIQKLDPGNELVLIEIDGTDFGADVLRFQSHLQGYTEEEIRSAISSGDELPLSKIVWQGRDYFTWPASISGLESNSDGSPASPSLSVANVDSSITALCLAYQDMSQAKVTIHRTLKKYLDSDNFPGGNDDADPDQESVELWYISRKSSEDKNQVTFELASPADVGGMKIGRKMTAYCQWCIKGQYRGADCGYSGEQMYTVDDKPTDDPSLDKCSGTLAGCKVRFGENNQLPHGGFPAVRLIKR